MWKVIDKKGISSEYSASFSNTMLFFENLKINFDGAILDIEFSEEK